MKANPGSTAATMPGDESQEAQLDTEAASSKPKKKDNTLLFVGVAAIALMALKGR